MKVRIAIYLCLCLSTARSALPAVLFQTVVPQRLLPKAKIELQSSLRCLKSSSPRNHAISLQSLIQRVGGISSLPRSPWPVTQRKRGISAVTSMRGGSNDEAPSHDQTKALKQRIKVVVITGPTAVGKSALAEKLALVRTPRSIFFCCIALYSVADSLYVVCLHADVCVSYMDILCIFVCIYGQKYDDVGWGRVCIRLRVSL
jgi:hypothetical protein